MDIAQQVRELAEQAKKASYDMALTTEDERNHALIAMARALRKNKLAIMEANAQDMEAARAAGVKESLLDRLMLDEGRVREMASALEALVALPDPLGNVLSDDLMYNGIVLQRVSVPLGVVAVVYEARPNVTADAAGICLKSGNAVVLRGGSMAAHSNEKIASVLAEAAVESGLPEGCIVAITTTDRQATDALMRLHGIVDVLVPRGGAGLIKHCVEYASVPVIETGTGNCHVYVHMSADPLLARDILINAKCRRYGVCNACETLLVDRFFARVFLPDVMRELAGNGVVMHTCEYATDIAEKAGIEVIPATEEDWATEYLAPEIAIRCVEGVEEAIAHINTYGTHHSEAIAARDEKAIEAFTKRVDAAAVYVNASTAFTDGGQFGLGAEIGISTQKLHVRGPFALEGLTSYKYIARGNGQVRVK